VLALEVATVAELAARMTGVKVFIEFAGVLDADGSSRVT
jgi:hypothetical protein